MPSSVELSLFCHHSAHPVTYAFQMSHFYLIFHFQLKYCRETDSYLIFIFFFTKYVSTTDIPLWSGSRPWSYWRWPVGWSCAWRVAFCWYSGRYSLGWRIPRRCQTASSATCSCWSLSLSLYPPPPKSTHRSRSYLSFTIYFNQYYFLKYNL